MTWTSTATMGQVKAQVDHHLQEVVWAIHSNVLSSHSWRLVAMSSTVNSPSLLQGKEGEWMRFLSITSLGQNEFSLNLTSQASKPFMAWVQITWGTISSHWIGLSHLCWQRRHAAGPISQSIPAGGIQEKNLLCYCTCPLEHLPPPPRSAATLLTFHKRLKMWLSQLAWDSNGKISRWSCLID